ncbi:ABC transporter substrate-binding protein [Paraburkholderia xenovorans]|uniref:ABC transporter substrate-binding protein n=1 Tax=Paraburkholderia xenovorans TaxID=36873 RepID=UPI0015594AF6|nr:ABC transporter substrate-binding protein [Paraburkholderia xenovorans]
MYTLASHHLKQHARSIKLALIAAAFTATSAHAATATIDFSKLKKDDAIYASLPQKIKDAGFVNAATESDYPPFDFLDDKNQLTGADIELSHALGQVLGVPIRNVNTDFSAIIPGIQAGRFDVGISSIGDYTSREATMDFVDYYQGGTSFLTKQGAKGPKSMDDVCGTTVGVLKGTSSETQAKSTSDYCTLHGKPAVTVNAYPTQSAAILALTSGRIQSVSGDSATNGYSASNPSLKIVNGGQTVYGDRPYYGIAVPKNSPLVDPLMKAMKIVMDSGVYLQILNKYGLGDGALNAPLKNQPLKQ